ncbi:hypothetical protein MNV49_000240 [Pseudohyphozyma bogoriensis]|nr:hypothetical protein MNV49_000240 [Pseudohyphozyma bogoriensis]
MGLESVQYESSAWEDYLRETGTHEDLIIDHDAPHYSHHPPSSTSDVADSEIGEYHALDSPLAPSSPLAASSSLPPAALPPPTTTTRFAESIKYSLATSALLTPQLAEAIPLYPAHPTRASPSPLLAPSTIASDAPEVRHAEQEAPKMEWDDGWEYAGQPFYVLALKPTIVLAALASFVVVTLFSIFESLATPTPPPGPAPPSPQKEKETVLQKKVVYAVDELVKASQAVDLRVSRAVSRIKEVECVSWGLGLSYPLPPISRIENNNLPRARVASSSPLAASAPASSSPHLRALPLRTTLRTTISSLTSTLNDTRVVLRSLEGSTSPIRTAPSVTEEEDWTKPLILSSSTSSRPSTPTPRARKVRPSSVLSPPLLNLATLRSISDDTPPPPTPEQRASSRFGHRHNLSNSSVSLSEDELRNGGAAGGEGLIQLQDGFETLHAVRRGLLWRLLGMVDHPNLTESVWEETRDLLEGLIDTLWEKVDDVEKAYKAEFGEGVDDGVTIRERKPRPASWHREIGGIGALAGPASNAGAGAAGAAVPRPGPAGERTRGNRPLSLSFASNYSVYPSSPPPSHSSPASNASSTPTPALIRRPSASKRSRPISFSNFAPPPPQSTLPTPLGNFETSSTALTIKLKSIATKLHVVQDDLRRGVEENDVERVLTLYESVRGDLEGLGKHWEESRVALNGILRPRVIGRREEEDEEESENEGTSLERIEDVDVDREVAEEDEGKEGSAHAVFESELPTPETTPPRKSWARSDVDEDFVVPVGRPEELYEAIVEDRRVNGGGQKLSREERIRLMKEQREKDVSGRKGSVGGGAGGTAGMVAELKDVLVLLKGRSKLPPDV